MTTIIIGAVLAIGVLGALASVFKHYNAPKTLEEQRKIDEQKIAAKEKQRQDQLKKAEERHAAAEAKRKEREQRRDERKKP